jgi:hypothetical protein
MSKDLTDLQLLHELEPVVEKNLNRQLSMRKDWNPPIGGPRPRSARTQSRRRDRRIHHRHIARRPIPAVEAAALRVRRLACGAPR